MQKNRYLKSFCGISAETHGSLIFENCVEFFGSCVILDINFLHNFANCIVNAVLHPRTSYENARVVFAQKLRTNEAGTPEKL